jgi:hypothetical protein
MHSNSILCGKSGRLPLLIVAAAFAMLALAAQASAQKIIAYDVPGAGTGAWQGTIGIGINSNGAITGVYVDANNAAHGFLRTPEGKFTIFDAPGVGTGLGPCPIYYWDYGFQGTYPFGMNREGVIPGYFLDANNVYHGFLRRPDGKITTFEVPGAGTGPGQGTVFGDINPSGTVAGYYMDAASVSHGFLRSPDGRFTKFDVPDAGKAGGQGTFPQFFSCLDPDGTVTGFYVDRNNAYHSFVRHPEGRFTTFEAPNAAMDAGLGTISYSMNPAGETVGPYFDASGVAHGFLRTREGSFTTINVPGAGIGAGQGTFPEGNNDWGQIVGQYVDANGVNHGFVRELDGKLITFDVPGEGTGAGQGTVPLTNNSEGMVNGFYLDANNSYHSFVRLPW